MANPQNSMTEREQREAYNTATYGNNIPNAADIKAKKDEEEKRRLYRAAKDSGATDEQARARVEGTGIGSVTTNLDRSAYEASMREKNKVADPQLGRFKTYGDKATFDTKQALRKLTGQTPLAADQQEFSTQLETSKKFGADSALLTPAGQAKAMQSAINAGLSPIEASSQVKTAADVLKSSLDKAKAAPPVAESKPTIAQTFATMGKEFNPKGLPYIPDTESSKPATVAPPISPVTTTNKPLVIPEQNVEEKKKEEKTSSFPYAGAANVLGKYGTGVVSNIGTNVTKATEGVVDATKSLDILKGSASAQPWFRNLTAGSEVAAENTAALLGKSKEAAEASKALREAEVLAKFLGPASKVGGALGTLGKFAGGANKLKELYHTGKFFGNKDYQDETIKEMSDFGERGAKAFGSEGSLGDKASYVGEALSKGPDTMKTLLSLGALQTQNRKAQEDAAAASKSYDKAKKLQDLRLEARRANISDEQFKNLSVEERVALSKQIRSLIK